MVTTEKHFEFTDMGHAPPDFCHGCSSEIDPSRPFVRWAFQGRMITCNNKVIVPSSEPFGAVDDIETESMCEVLGDMAECGPYINLCWKCALKIGSNLIEDGALCRHAQKEYPSQKSDH